MGSSLHHLPGSAGARTSRGRRVAGFLADALVAAAFPQGCHVCRKAVFRRDLGIACEECWNDPIITPVFLGRSICETCGLPGTGRCLSCAPKGVSAARSVGEYAGALRATLLDVKRRPQVPAILVDLLESVWRESACLQQVDAIVPVPLHPDRLAERGHNQAEVIARALGERVGIQVEPRAVARIRAGARRRIGSDRTTRERESAGAFSAAKRLCSGQRLLLVDDVFTTGATLGACAKALRDAGAADVVAMTVARVRLGSAG